MKVLCFTKLNRKIASTYFEGFMPVIPLPGPVEIDECYLRSRKRGNHGRIPNPAEIIFGIKCSFLCQFNCLTDKDLTKSGYYLAPTQETRIRWLFNDWRQIKSEVISNGFNVFTQFKEDSQSQISNSEVISPEDAQEDAHLLYESGVSEEADEDNEKRSDNSSDSSKMDQDEIDAIYDSQFLRFEKCDKTDVQKKQ